MQEEERLRKQAAAEALAEAKRAEAAELAALKAEAEREKQEAAKRKAAEEKKRLREVAAAAAAAEAAKAETARYVCSPSTAVCSELLFACLNYCLPSTVCPQLFALNYCLPSTNTGDRQASTRGREDAFTESCR
jgi:hypothetical protein